jgi:hypothetical protein
LASGSTLARVFVVMALLACNSNAASLQPSETRQKWEDLEVITLDSKGNPAKAVYYSHDQLLTLGKKVIDPKSLNVTSGMPPQPTFDDETSTFSPPTETLGDLQGFFRQTTTNNRK